MKAATALTSIYSYRAKLVQAAPVCRNVAWPGSAANDADGLAWGTSWQVSIVHGSHAIPSHPDADPDNAWLQGPWLLVLRTAVVVGWGAIGFAALQMLSVGG